jgi:cobalt/nickel transport system ATP-binding protein
LQLIVGLLRPVRGRIAAFGQDRVVEADFHEVRRRVGLLFQDADDQLFCPTVAEDVAFGPLNLGKPRDEVRRIVAETLNSLGLAGYEHRITYHLSGGEKRLVALATVLAMQPDVLLLDEPNGELDDAAVERLVSILAGLPQAMIVVSHSREFWERVTTGVVELREGKVVAAGRLQ